MCRWCESLYGKVICSDGMKVFMVSNMFRWCESVNGKVICADRVKVCLVK